VFSMPVFGAYAAPPRWARASGGRSKYGCSAARTGPACHLALVAGWI